MVKRLTTRPPRRDSATTMPLVRSEVAKADLDRNLVLLCTKAQTASTLLLALPSGESDFVDANSRILTFTVAFEKSAKALESKIPSDDGPNLQMLTLAIQTLIGGIDSGSLFIFTDKRAAGEIRSSSLSKRKSDSDSLILGVMTIASSLFDSFSVEKPV